MGGRDIQLANAIKTRSMNGEVPRFGPEDKTMDWPMAPWPTRFEYLIVTNREGDVYNDEREGSFGKVTTGDCRFWSGIRMFQASCIGIDDIVNIAKDTSIGEARMGVCFPKRWNMSRDCQFAFRVNLN
ncbi:hypothetical protein PILCRDRAFT_285880 [Piloderma croceum F 1598]|uniref:Uncharacterized protein n=1 Tax=Piloderma croceum (strain F 1598) TaxID=765440 RepID=A0A0C3BME6_PILCF|nr:hypothetical protein PILCRDRAFT_285880 [Piloderma croceum F 1598]